MSLFASFDLELPDDPDFLALEQLNPAWPWWWMRLVQAAKRFNRGGRVCNADGRPVRARGLAMIHHRSPAREQEWAEMLDACVELGLLTDEGGEYRIAHWRRWHRSPSDEPEAVRDRVARHRAATRDTAPVTGGNEGVTDGNGCNETEQSRAEQRHSIAEQPPLPPQGQPAAAESEPLPDLPPAPPYAARPDTSALDSTRPHVGKAMQDLGILASPTGKWWTDFASWAQDGLNNGATIEDLLGALAFGRDKTIHDRPNRPWPYAMRIAAEELGNVVERRKMTEAARARGRPLPRPYVFEPPTAIGGEPRCIPSKR